MCSIVPAIEGQLVVGHELSQHQLMIVCLLVVVVVFVFVFVFEMLVLALLVLVTVVVAASMGVVVAVIVQGFLVQYVERAGGHTWCTPARVCPPI